LPQDFGVHCNQGGFRAGFILREPMQILVVEDERKLASAIAEGLESDGYDVAITYSGEGALQIIRAGQFDLVLLDVMLPQLNGFETLRSMRRSGFRVPVLMLTSRDSIDDRVLGLDAGADDYLVKPFAFPELLARVRALIRRGQPRTDSSLQVGDLKMDLAGRTVVRGTHEIDLTSREFDLLEYLLVNRGTVVSREMLARNVWKQTARYNSLDNVIDVQMARVRRKIDDPFTRKLLHTVRGVGFVLRDEE
jgi:two-component system, OmpR family, copper resistance phosphate regulon response regulator CusR